jgi:translation initiation factor 1
MNNINELLNENDFDDSKVDIRKQARNGKKCMTLIEGLAEDLDIKKIAKHLAKTLQCSASILKDEKIGEVIKLSGDKIKEVKEFLIKEDIYKESNIIIHA